MTDEDVTTCTQEDDDSCATSTHPSLGRCGCGYVFHDIPRSTDDAHDELCDIVNAADPHACTCGTDDQKHHNYDCPQDDAYGLLCHTHFEMENGTRKRWMVDECADCQQARKDEAARIQRTETIDPSQPYGQHIALTCKNHRNLRWSTKNIGWIGARSVFYFSDALPECDCPFSDLILAGGPGLQ
jgi:hypothetical protein